MQLRKTMMMLTALSALSVVMMGCPGEEEGSLGCTTDAECLEGEICNVAARACVQTCSTPADCPESARAECSANSATDNRTVCKCTTSELCAREVEGTVCSTLDKVCTAKCDSNDDCSAGRTCDTATGQCTGGGGATCTYGSCASGEVCGATSNRCEAGATCTGEAQSTCGYGQFCGTGKCQDVAKPTCGNLAAKTAVLNFTPATGTGYIIYNVDKAEFGGTTNCGTGTQRLIPRVYLYAKNGTLPTSDDLLEGGFYVKTDREEIALNAGNLFDYQRSADGKSASVKVFLCVDNALTQAVVAFYFTGGNGYCATLMK